MFFQGKKIDFGANDKHRNKAQLHNSTNVQVQTPRVVMYPVNRHGELDLRAACPDAVRSARCVPRTCSCQCQPASLGLVFGTGDILRLGVGGVKRSIQLGITTEDEEDAVLCIAGEGESGLT